MRPREGKSLAQGHESPQGRVKAGDPEPQAHALCTAFHTPLNVPCRCGEARTLLLSQGQIRLSPSRWAQCQAQPSPGDRRAWSPALHSKVNPWVKGYRRWLPAWPSSKTISQHGEELWAESLGLRAPFTSTPAPLRAPGHNEPGPP